MEPQDNQTANSTNNQQVLNNVDQQNSDLPQKSPTSPERSLQTNNTSSLPSSQPDKPINIDAENKAKKGFFIVLVTWLSATPVGLLLYSLTNTLLSNNYILHTIWNIINLSIGLYGFFGWIPLIIFGVKWSKAKK